MLRDLQPAGFNQPERWALQQFIVLQMAIETNDQARMQTALDTIEGPGTFIHLWQQPQSTTFPGWCIASNDGDLIVVIRGTTNAQQWVGHIAGAWGEEVHKGFAGFYVHIGMRDPVESKIWPTLKQVLDAPPPGGWKRVFISGHSYGGGCAQYLAWFMTVEQHYNVPLQVVTFGAPRIFASERPVPTSWPHFNVMLEGDPVVHLPPKWANLRMVISTATSSVLGKVGLGTIGKFVGGKAAGHAFELPNWNHMGDTVRLRQSGNYYRFDGPVDPPELGEVKNTEAFKWHLTHSGYWPSLLVDKEPGQFRSKEYRDFLIFGTEVAHWPGGQDAVFDFLSYLTAFRRQELAKVVFPGVPTLPPKDFDEMDGWDFDIDTRRASSSIRATTLGGTAMSVWKYTARISWGKNSRTVSIHRSGPGTMDAARTDAFLWVSQYARLFGNTLAGPAKEGARFIGVPGAPVIEYVTVSDPATLRSSQRFRVPGSGGNPYKVVGTISVPADMPWVSVSLTIRATNGTNSVRDVISILGQPDGVADEGGYNPGAPCPNGFTFDTMLNGYLTYILAGGANSFGCMGRDYANAPNAPVESFITQTDGTVAVAASTANWLDQEFIKLIGTKNPYFNREWQVTLNADDTYTLKGSRAAVAGTLPSGGQGYRTRRVDGTKYQVYYTYAESLSTFNPEDRVFISERKRANPFASSRSSRRRRTPVK